MSDQLTPGVCSICLTHKWLESELKHLDIYISGSEGIMVCPDCNIVITNTVSSMRSIACRAKNQTLITKQGTLVCL